MCVCPDAFAVTPSRRFHGVFSQALDDRSGPVAFWPRCVAKVQAGKWASAKVVRGPI